MSVEKVPASAEMRDGFGLEWMEPPARAREFFEGLFARYPFTPAACRLFRRLRLEVGDLSREWGGGFWWGDRDLVTLRGNQDEAAVHELAHAFWHDLRLRDDNAHKLMLTVQRLADEPDARYRRAAALAHQYVHGIPTQPDANSPTGYWRGMPAEQNDWEMFAGLASGVMGNLRLLPPYIRPFFADLFGQEPASAPTR